LPNDVIAPDRGGIVVVVVLCALAPVVRAADEPPPPFPHDVANETTPTRSSAHPASAHRLRWKCPVGVVAFVRFVGLVVFVGFGTTGAASVIWVSCITRLPEVDG
jgi:hypothetical protein